MFGFQKMGIRIVSLVLVLFSLFCQVGFVFAQESEAETTLTAIVRKSASYDSANIGRLVDGSTVTVLGERGVFYKIDCYDMKGYIAKSQVVHNAEEDKYYVNCKADSSETQVMTYVEPEEMLHLRHEIINLAKKQLGTPYVYGGTRPGGFDCSGLMGYIFGAQGIALHRGSSGQVKDGIIVAKDSMQPGDLVFFKVPWDTTVTSHVGVYVGNNQIIHSGNHGVEYASLDDSWCASYYLCARRVLNTAPTESVAVAQTGTGLMILSGISGRTVQ